MNKTPVRVEHVTTIIRHEMLGPPGEGVDMKHWSYLYSVFLRDFQKTKGREPEYDNDWWIEPMDDGIAICYIHEKKVSGAGNS